MHKLIMAVVVAIAAAAWFWFNQEEPGPTKDELQLQENARLIKECIRREQTLNAGARKAGGDNLAVDSEALCAEKYKLYKSEGQWHQLDAYDNDVWASQ